MKDIFRNMLNLFFYRQIQRHNNDYARFKDNNLCLSKKQYSTLQELEREDFPYDTYIAGSDQVWNINAQDFDDAYFLPFVKKGKKIAYAVSLGATNPNYSKEREKYSKYVGDFTGISVREKNAQKWIRELANKDVNICVDPTLLLSTDEWETITGEREIKGNIHDKDTNDDRASFLLSQLGLSDRYIRKSEVLKMDLMTLPVYPEKSPINSTVKESLEFLDSFCF